MQTIRAGLWHRCIDKPEGRATILRQPRGHPAETRKGAKAKIKSLNQIMIRLDNVVRSTREGMLR